MAPRLDLPEDGQVRVRNQKETSENDAPSMEERDPSIRSPMTDGPVIDHRNNTLKPAAYKKTVTLPGRKKRVEFIREDR